MKRKRTKKRTAKKRRKTVRRNAKKRPVRRKKRKASRKRTTKKRTKKRTTRKRSVSRNKKKRSVKKRKKRRTTSRRKKTTRRKKRKVSGNRKRRKSTRKKRRTRRNPGAASANPRKRRKKSSRRKSSRRLPSLYGSRLSYNTPFSIAPNKKRRPKKRRKARRNPAVSRNFGMVTGNPRRNPGKALAGNLRSLVSPKMMVAAAQVTVGSVASPILGQSLAKLVAQMTGGRVVVSINSPAGYVLQGLAGAGVATVTTMFTKNSSMGKNILLGTIGGIGADIGKRLILPLLVRGSAPAAAAPAAEASAGVSGVRQDLAREVATMSAYATGADILGATVGEEF